jgi:hypothetical protein
MKTRQVQQNKDIVTKNGSRNIRKTTTANIPYELVKGKTTNSLLIFIPNVEVEETDDGLLISRSR